MHVGGRENQYHSLEVDPLDLDDAPDDSLSNAPAALDATQATLGDVTTTLLLAEVGLGLGLDLDLDLDLVKRYSTRLKPRTDSRRATVHGG
ncbi:MAG TPA: hypothetical protein VIU87_24785 [Mycobacterium sp.]